MNYIICGLLFLFSSVPIVILVIISTASSRKLQLVSSVTGKEKKSDYRLKYRGSYDMRNKMGLPAEARTEGGAIAIIMERGVMKDIPFFGSPSGLQNAFAGTFESREAVHWVTNIAISRKKGRFTSRFTGPGIHNGGLYLGVT